MSKAIQKSGSTMKTIRDLIMSQKDQIALALPKHMTPDRLIRVSLTALRRTPKLAQCNHASVLGAIIQSAQLGLETDGSLGHAYLVPYKGECQLQIGYRGMIDLARRSGQIVSISARIVYENDDFKYSYGLEETLKHIPTMNEKGKPMAVYAVARLVGGGYQFEVLSMDQVEKIRKSSPAGNSGPWKTHWDEMARKTAVRRLFKYLPVSVEIQKAVGLDDMASAGVPQQLDAMVIDVEPEPPQPPQTGLDALTEKLKEEQGGNCADTDADTDTPDHDPETGEVFEKDSDEQSGPTEEELYEEMEAIAKDLYGNQWKTGIKSKCESAGYNYAKLTGQQISSLIDIFNEEANK